MHVFDKILIVDATLAICRPKLIIREQLFNFIYHALMMMMMMIIIIIIIILWDTPWAWSSL